MKLRLLYDTVIFGLVGAMLLAGLPLKAKAAGTGALDPAFGGGGKVSTNVGPATDFVNAVTIQPDGKIIVVGWADLGFSGDFVVVRYNPNGSLDTTFDTDGIVTTNFGNSEAAFAAVVQNDGKIVVVGYSAQSATDADFALARYNPNGSLDSSFGGDGTILTDFAGGYDAARAVVIQADGRIVVGGIADNANGQDDAAVARYNLNGTLDTTFDGDGRVAFQGGTVDICDDIKLQPDGKIVGVGTSQSSFLVFRLNPNGLLDTTFDGNGLVFTDISGDDFALSVAIQQDGKIIAAGGADGLNNTAMARYNSDGSLDNSFDGDGRVLLNVNSVTFDRINEIVLQGDGKILAGLFSTGGAFLGINALRFNVNGSLDPTFGNNGVVTTAVQTGNSTRAIALSGTEIIVAGQGGGSVNVARFILNAQPTASNDFDGDGFSDYAIFRPSAGTWYIMQSLTSAVRIVGFGSNGDVPLDGDFDGDGLNDLAIYRPGAGEWWFQRSSDNTVFAAQFGAPGDKPLPGDVDKDGKSDFVIWRPSNGNYFVLRSSSNFASFFSFPFGANGDVPVGTAIFP